MGVLQRVVKPRNQKSKRALEDREAKLIENNKSTLIVRGTNCSATVLQCLKELHSLKKPDCEFYSQKNDILDLLRLVRIFHLFACRLE